MGSLPLNSWIQEISVEIGSAGVWNRCGSMDNVVNFRLFHNLFVCMASRHMRNTDKFHNIFKFRMCGDNLLSLFV